ncbi:MAG TPA: ATP synthase F1 subunit gamma [Candidatus Binatus sp.]|uniref:ATP synthase F1 subunit gamma n=1 Tax=Candidatus Binatus sp. TaxID=2811406 RepID=UPI002B470B6B|nr:ATP synthase F1 subunit gamma [Candidatus Binatus sp.]HKN13717.1 ATP synthase F1 subunit gamma [Candidatus Binatus sp.]
MASLKAIRRRIASAKSTQQITRALKLVSAARLRRAQEALVNALPYSEALARVADSLLTSEGISVGPVEGAQKRSLLVVVASDRGLAGGYNSYLFRAAEAAQREIRGNGLDIELFAVGKKAVDHFRRTNVPVALSRIDNFPRLATIALARDIAAKMLADYSSGAIDEAGIVYTRFQSAIVQKPVYERLLPIKPPGDAGIKEGASVDATISKSEAGKIDYLVEPSRAELVPVVLRGYLEASVYHALLESEASEQGARMTAMDAATNNANEMISSLTLEMNRARQAQITRELMDIVGGAEALR